MRLSKIIPARLAGFLCAALLAVGAHTANAQDWDKDFKEFPKVINPTSDKVILEPANPTTPDGLIIKASPESGAYPGIRILPPEGEYWDFSNYTCLELVISSQGEAPVYASMRVDNPGDWKQKPWNVQAARLAKGDRKKITVYFGYSYNKPYPFDAKKVSAIQVFTGKAAEGQELKIESLKLGKSPSPYKPNVAPIDGYVLGGAGKTIVKKYIARNGATASGGNAGEPLAVVFSGPDQSVAIEPEQSKWDLREGYELEFKIRNTGTTPANPTAKASSNRGDTDIATLEKPLAPGKSDTLTVSFIYKESKDAGLGRKNPFFENNKADAIVLMSGDSEGAQSITVDSIRLTAPPVKLPDWVGKRPPVDGDWELTFTEEFNADTLDRTKWRIHAPNYWDKRSVFSENNVEFKDGKAVLIYEKKFSHHNDDPNHKRTGEYTTGFLDSYGKWVQRYGYFECRVKLPKAPGLWPAFWLMPERGVDAGEQWHRQDTGKGGMEFDILEFLSGWGPYRFTTAFHYDGYGKEHKATGAGVYAGHDEEGYIVSGLLWLPGLAVIYTNGKEVARWETDRISNVESCIIFTHVGGGWDNEPIDDKKLPGYTYIDYVRVWQRADLASEVDGYQPDSQVVQSDS